ncbi:carboxypeptidase-like regulatory domain-containing protein [Wenyingzhuangia sp. IMCC45574]
MKLKIKYMLNNPTKNQFFVRFLVFILFITVANAQQKKIILKGTIYDEMNETVPFVTVGIVNKTIGTASTEDGEFALMVTESELNDTLYVSSLGFDSFKMKVQDYIDKKDRKIILKENVVALDAVVLLKPKDYVQKALKNLKLNTLSKSHLKTILYRRAASEKGKAKFFVENYLRVKSKGPAYGIIGRIEVKEARQSADYRYWKREQWRHAIISINDLNPLTPNSSETHSRNIKKFNWKKVGSSSYEGEDVVILEGSNPKNKWEKITLYVGIDNYQVFRIERGKVLYIFKKHTDGKTYLSYFKSDWRFPKWNIPAHLHGTPAETLEYKNEAFVLSIETEDKKKMKIKDYGANLDMASMNLPYHPEFWKELSTPPDTKFYKKLKGELEAIYGVPLETQYKLVNK